MVYNNTCFYGRLILKFSNSDIIARAMSNIMGAMYEPVPVIKAPARVAVKEAGINMVFAMLKFNEKYLVP